MRHYILKSQDNSVLFEGSFSSKIQCLEQAVIKNVNLNGIDLSHWNLSNACLDGAHMEGANFTNSNLTGANLSEAKLYNSNFSGAALYNTCLCEADLRNCNFEDASFGATDIAGADIAGSIFSTLSSFHLDFSLVQTMSGCLFKNPCGNVCTMSRPPLVIHGVMPTPIIVFDRHVKIGGMLKPHAEWFGKIAARYLEDRHARLAA